jgi:hypothetical protein
MFYLLRVVGNHSTSTEFLWHSKLHDHVILVKLMGYIYIYIYIYHSIVVTRSSRHHLFCYFR